MSTGRIGRSLVRAIARVVSLVFPAAFRRRHADDFADVAEHHWSREAGRRRPAGAAIAASRLIVADALASAPGMWMEKISGAGHDLRLAARAARHRPGFSLVVVLTLGIGMGASTAAFDALDRAVLRPLPFYRSQELSLLVMDDVQRHFITSVPIAALNEWRAKSTTARQVEVFLRMSSVRTTETGSEVRDGVGISGGLPGLLGIRPIAGRLITPSDAQPSAPAVVMIGEDYWRSAFGGDAGAIGRTITIAGKPMQIAGVWPAGARLDFFETPDVFRVLPAGAEYGAGSWVQVIARRQPGRSVADMEQELAALTPHDPSETNSTLHYRVKATAPGSLLLGEEFVTGVWLVFAGGLILLGASIVNTGHLLLERAAGRQHELGVRLALGGSRARLFRLFLAEGVVYAGAALAVGACAAIGLERMISTVEPRLYRDAAGAGLFGRAFIFAAGSAVVAALGCSIAPLARARRRDVAHVLGQGGTRVTGRRSTVTAGLVSAQAAFAVLLVFSAMLMARSLNKLMAVDPGIELAHLAEMSVSLPAARYPAPEDRRRYFTEARGALDALPGVTGVVTSGTPMLQAPLKGGLPWLDGEPLPDPPAGANTAVIKAGPGFFSVMGIRAVAGRIFDPTETNVAVVGASFARAHGGQVLGRALHLPGSKSTDPSIQIVGVVNDVRYSGLSNDRVMWPAVYVPSAPLAAGDAPSRLRFIVRTDGQPGDVIAGARRAFAAIDPQVPLLGPSTGPEVLQTQTAQHRFVAMLLTGLAAMGFVLAMGGVYGAVALAVSRRKREVGLRLALGASATRLTSAFVRTGLRPVAIGAAAGALVVWLAAPRLEVLLFRVPPHDTISAVVGLGAVMLAAALAAVLPARQICRIDPARTLREN